MNFLIFGREMYIKKIVYKQSKQVTVLFTQKIIRHIISRSNNFPPNPFNPKNRGSPEKSWYFLLLQDT